jgi:hypothetical protein
MNNEQVRHRHTALSYCSPLFNYGGLADLDIFLSFYFS